MLREFPVPAGQEEQAAAWLAGAVPEPAPPREAATVLLVRDGDAGPEVFLLRRHLGMAFAGGLYAFPGGAVDPRDAVLDVPWAGPGPDAWAAELGATPERARALVCAAVRETFEECGLLLAGRPGRTPEAPADLAEAERDRLALVEHRTSVSELLRRRGLVLRSDLLRSWAHWTTPLHERRRYDTRFFLAVAPSGARHVGGEADQSGWWPAAEVLDLHARGDAPMLPPTLVALEEVAAAADAAQLWAAARSTREVVPRLRRRGDRLVLVADLPEPAPVAGPR